MIAKPDGAFAVDARIKVTLYQPQDPFLRKLRQPAGSGRRQGTPQSQHIRH